MRLNETKVICLLLICFLLSGCFEQPGSVSSSSSPASAVTAPLIPAPPIQTTLTVHTGNGYSCYYSEHANETTTLWCWGNNSFLGLNSASPVAVISRSFWNNESATLSHLTFTDNSICFDATVAQRPAFGGTGWATYCFGRVNANVTTGIGGQPVLASPTGIPVSLELNFGLTPSVAMDSMLPGLIDIENSQGGTDATGMTYSQDITCTLGSPGDVDCGTFVLLNL